MGAGVPETPADIPDPVRQPAGGDSLTAVWRNEPGGWTFRARGRQETRYIEWQPYTGLHAEDRADVDLLVEA